MIMEAKEKYEEGIEAATKLIREAKHLVVFTGAGISTNAGLPDYRGENGVRSRKRKRRMDPTCQRPKKIDFSSLIPTKTHMFIKELVARGLCKHVVSQNIDGLHLKSGIEAKNLSEIHGNATCARCETCGKIYVPGGIPKPPLCSSSSCPSSQRSTEARLRARTRHGNGKLKRYVVNFNEEVDLSKAALHSHLADVSLVMGTSLKVDPFASLATACRHLIIVNKLETVRKYDKLSESHGVRLYGDADAVVIDLANKLFGQNFVLESWNGESQADFVPLEEDQDSVFDLLAGTGS